MTPRSRLAALGFVLLAVATTTFADDWPQWRGPNRDGISKETGLLKQWPEGEPKLLWQVNDAGGGYSTPAVVGQRLYVISSQGEADESATSPTAWSPGRFGSARSGPTTGG